MVTLLQTHHGTYRSSSSPAMDGVASSDTQTGKLRNEAASPQETPPRFPSLRQEKPFLPSWEVGGAAEGGGADLPNQTGENLGRGKGEAIPQRGGLLLLLLILASPG